MKTIFGFADEKCSPFDWLEVPSISWRSPPTVRQDNFFKLRSYSFGSTPPSTHITTKCRTTEAAQEAVGASNPEATNLEATEEVCSQ